MGIKSKKVKLLDTKNNESQDMETETNQEDEYENKSGEIIHNKLYVQFPCKLPEDASEELKAVDDRIKEVRLPRQKKARFCFLYFESERHCAEVETILNNQTVCGHRLFTNRNRKIDDPDYKNKLKIKSIERKIAKRDAKRLKKQLKKKMTVIERQPGSLTNKIVVTNIPENISEAKIKQQFPNFVEFAFREKPRRVCFITFSSTEEASKFIKHKPKIDDTELAVRAAIQIHRKTKVLEEPVQEVTRKEDPTVEDVGEVKDEVKKPVKRLNKKPKLSKKVKQIQPKIKQKKNKV